LSSWNRVGGRSRIERDLAHPAARASRRELSGAVVGLASRIVRAALPTARSIGIGTSAPEEVVRGDLLNREERSSPRRGTGAEGRDGA
jgi:hypothetical protein